MSFKTNLIKELEKQHLFNNIKTPTIKPINNITLLKTIILLLEETEEDIQDKPKWIKTLIKPIGKYLATSSKNTLKYIKSFNVSNQEVVRQINLVIYRSISAESKIIDIATKRLDNVKSILIFGYNPLIRSIILRNNKAKIYLCDDPHNPSLNINYIKDVKDVKDNINYLHINSLSYVLSNGIDIVLLGCNEVMSNGDISGQIGTSLVSLIANNNNVPVLVCCETLSFTKKIRTSIEIKNIKQVRPNYKKYSLDYDIIPSKYISQIITEKGIIHPSVSHIYSL